MEEKDKGAVPRPPGRPPLPPSPPPEGGSPHAVGRVDVGAAGPVPGETRPLRATVAGGLTGPATVTGLATNTLSKT